MYDDTNYRINANDVLAQTNGGLDIIIYYYPDARDVADGRKKHFKKRAGERTASARVTLHESGVWIVTDFGGDSKPRNAIEIVREEENIGFKEALEFIAGKWNLQIEGAKKHQPRADFNKRPAKPDEEEGQFYPDIRKDEAGKVQYLEHELREFGPFVEADHLERLKIYALRGYVRIKDRQAIEIKAKEDFPIFMIDRGDFQKIYQPKSPDKAYRFTYAGQRPKNYVFGLDYIRKVYQERLADYHDKSTEEEDDSKPFKLPYIFHCMGDRDAVNVFSLDKDYLVIWLNSESQTLTGSEYKEIMNMTDHFIQIPDLDGTGVKHGINQALKFLDLKTIWLPKKLREFRDFRGNKCKDVTDFIKRWNEKRVKAEFRQLVRTAMPARFWDTIVMNAGKDTEYTKLKFNPEYFFYFLNLRGIYHFPIKEDKDIFIRIQDHVVSEIEVITRIKKEVKNFLRTRRSPVDVLNMVNTTQHMSENSLSGLAYPEDSYIPKELDFQDAGHDFQFMFFADKIWKITKDGVEESKSDGYTNVVWREKVMNRKVKVLEDFFQITCDKSGNDRFFDINITEPGCHFLNYLVQVSRVHWKKDLEGSFVDPESENAVQYQQEHKFSIDGPNLDDDEIHEQKMHLINKIYALGYLLHRYKDPSRPWAVFTMDNKESTTGESSGGSGKSIFMKSATHFMKWEYLNGKNKKLTQNPHVFENITEHTDYVLVDDADQYFDFDFFYNAITGHTEVNPKGTKSVKIPYEKSPKFGFTTNHTLRKNDESTQRRVLYTVFSDYYHENETGEYLQTRTPLSDLGIRLFDDFDDDQWNMTVNFMAQCVKFYLNHEKIPPPMGNVQKRNLRAEAGEIFMQWADVYFLDQMNDFIQKDKAFHDFQEDTSSKTWKPNRFTKSVKAWCLYHGYIYNPEEFCNSIVGNDKNAPKTKIVKSIEGRSVEHIYIQKKDLDQETNDQMAF